MYSENLEKLMELALADGELTEKEKQVLFKKAEAEGIDLDEFEMVLEAKLYEKTKNKIPISAVAPKSDKFGDVKKCPSCGAMVESFTTKCSDCGYNFRNIDSVNSIKDFFRDYQKVEDSVVVPVNYGGGGMIDKLFDGNKDQNEGARKMAVFTKKKEFIMHFPVPNSKEDILEFLSMAVPLASPAKKTGFSFLKKFAASGSDDLKNYDFLISEVWIQKCEQIIMKAKFSMKDEPKTLEEINYYTKELGIK